MSFTASGPGELIPDHLLMEVRPYAPGNAKERESFDNLATLYSILLTLEHLERAYIKDAVPRDDYEATCRKLIAQYKGALDLVRPEISSNVELFVKEYRLVCTSALRRVRTGVPATVEFGDQSGKGGFSKHTADAVAAFITLTDTLQMDMRAVDDVYPLLTQLMSSLGKITTLPPDFPSKVFIRDWLAVINGMKAGDRLNDEQVRQLTFDLERSLTLFRESLN